MPVSDLLTLTQLLSPAFPTGAFAYSQGLEWAVSEGRVTDAASLEAWLGDALRLGSGRIDAVLLAHALRDGADLAALDEIALALAPSRERAEETLALGVAFGRAASQVTGQGPEEHVLPVAAGRAARGLADDKMVIALYLQVWAGSLVQIGVRIIPLGQTDGQRVLAALAPAIAEVSVQAAETGMHDLTSSTFLGDLGGMLHETMPVRLFRT